MPNTITLCFATMTGNAESLANAAGERLSAAGHGCTIVDLASARPADLTTFTTALFFVSTWGDGEPPADAADFWYDLAKAALDLRGLSYAVFGLGDRDYPEFNAFARQLDERLAQLGGGRLLARAEADLDFEETYAPWIERLLPLLATTEVPAS